MKHFSWKTLIIGLVAGLLLGSAGTFTLVAIKLGFTQGTSSALSPVQQAYNNIQQNYYKPVSEKKLVNGAIRGMIATLNDPYSELFTDHDQTAFNDNISGKISGIGATIEKSPTGIRIVSALPQSPAAKAGIKPRDEIIQINRHSTVKMSVEQASALTRGKAGTQVKLVLKRGSTTFKKTITRAPIQVASVFTKVNPQNRTLGQITITQFSENTAKELKKAILKLEKKKVKKLIIDVRNNPGGMMDQALAAANIFVPNGKPLMTMVSRTEGSQTYKANPKYLHGFKSKLPVVVLVDEGSASAAEIFAAALQQSAQVPLVGEKTYGKGVVQTMNSLTKDSEMKITTAKWLTPKRQSINKKGLTPTYLVKYPAYLNLKAFTNQRTYQLNDQATDIKTAQQILSALKVSDLTATSRLDFNTQQALKNFQRQQHLTITGTLDQATRIALSQALLKQAQANDPMQAKALQILSQ